MLRLIDEVSEGRKKMFYMSNIDTAAIAMQAGELEVLEERLVQRGFLELSAVAGDVRHARNAVYAGYATTFIAAAATVAIWTSTDMMIPRVISMSVLSAALYKMHSAMEKLYNVASSFQTAFNSI
jgi:hypothetical protein